MMILTTALLISTLLQAASAQVPPADPVAPIAATPTMEWHAFSRSTATAYLVDLGSIATVGDVTTIRVAKVPRDKNAPVDIAWRLEDVALKCGAGEVKSLLTIEYAADGSEMGRYEGDDVWDPVGNSGYLEAMKDVACDGKRASGENFPTLSAFMASPR